MHSLFKKKINWVIFRNDGQKDIKSLFKKGGKNEASSYCGITLLSIIGKLFTRILNNRLNSWAEEYSIYVEAQAGFRKKDGNVRQYFYFE